MDEKLKSENMQKDKFSEWRRGVKAGVENGAMLTTYLFRYTSECMHHFVAKFSKFSSPQAARGH